MMSVRWFDYILGKQHEVFPCRCGETHKGNYAQENWNHHNCFHGPLSVLDSEQVMCILCGEVFELLMEERKALRDALKEGK